MPTIETNGIETYYEVTGEGPPVVFAHGASSDRQLWGPTIDRLSQDYTCIAYDIRGHGRSEFGDNPDISVELYADDLAALVDGLTLDDPAVVGLSMGGMIAMAYAVRHDASGPIVVTGAPTPEFSGLGERIARGAIPRLLGPPIRLIGYQRVMSTFNKIQLKIIGEDAAGDFDKVSQIRDEEPTMTTESYLGILRAMRRYQFGSLELEAIDVPVLVLAGEHEPEMNTFHRNRAAERIPNARADEVPDAGHNAHVDNPEWLATRIREFLLDVAPAPEKPTGATVDADD